MTAGMDLGAAMTSSSTVTIGVSAGPRSGPDGPRSGLNCFFLFSKIYFLCRSVTTDTINHLFFVSSKSYRLLKPIQNIGF
jgi:hypothetical protein